MKLTLTEITQQVADEWLDEGRMTVPPDSATLKDDAAFWEEVQRRFDAQEIAA